MKDYFSIALSNLKHRGLRSWLTIIGIFIGIAAVVSLVTMGDGLRTAITAQFATLSADKLTIENAGTGMGPPGSTVIRKLNDNDIEVISKAAGIEEIIPRLLRMMQLKYKDNVNFGYVASLPDDEKKIDIIYEAISPKLESGRLLGEGEYGKIILGSEIASEDTFGEGIKVGDKIIIKEKSFEVAGILKKAGSFQVNSVILMNEEDMKEILNIKDEYDFIVVQVKDVKQAGNVAEDIKKELRKDRDEDIGEEDFSVQTSQQAISSVNTLLDIINLVIVGIAAFSLVIGAIGIANTMYTSILERTKDIGVMKAIGAKNKDILYIFVIESGLLGLIGGIIGACLGMGLAAAVSSIANSAFETEILSVKFSYILFFSSILFAFVIGLISGLMPALQASKLKPVDAFRK